jgi:hypothetical protein
MTNNKTIIGYYQADLKTAIFCTNEQGELIILGNPIDFPPSGNYYTIYPVDFNQVFKWILTKKIPVCLDKFAFENYTKEFYKLCVTLIANNTAQLEDMKNDEFITVNFDFLTNTPNYKYN